jgi:large subunit ribosomal protein L25
MSNTITLTANKRELLGKGNARRMRRAGQVPVNVYAKGEEAKSLVISEAEAHLAQHHNGLITLDIAGVGIQSAVLKEIQIHPISNKILHLDFHAVKADEMITSVVPLVLEGEAAGLRQGGQLEQVLHELEIESLPANIPEVITVDVTALELNQALHVAELKLPEGVTAVSDAELIVAHCRAHKVTAEEAAEDAAAAEAAEEKEEADGAKKK